MPLSPARNPARPFSPALLLPLLAAVLIVPLALHGPSCGHDFGFHIQSWMEAAAQLRHGHLLPRWAFSPAYNAGEPRFLFYPPLSWLLGSILLLLLPPAVVPVTFTWIALTAAALAMYRLARTFTPSVAALLASAVYIANPYVLFTALERTAFAELLAAAWLPLLLRGALAPRIAALPIALPLALLWLTNAPAAVMGTYALVLILVCRLVFAWRASAAAPPVNGPHTAAMRPLLLESLAGLALGLALPAFYLLPAAVERRYVQIAMAIIPNMRIEDNFLFGHTGYGPHDQVLHTASLVALLVVILTAAALLLAWLGSRARPHAPDAASSARLPLTVLALAVTAMLWHITLPLWHLLPEMAFLQFPWRLLAVLGCVLGLATALAVNGLPLRPLATSLLALLLVAIAATLGNRSFRQGCEVDDLLPARLLLFQTHHGVGPTDEYTPVNADNDQLRWDDPAWWLADDPNTPGPHTVPNPAATILDYDQPPPLDQTVSGQTPMHLHLHLARPEALILNLRDYPAWRVTLNGRDDPARLQRDDGLLALPLPAGDDTLAIRWHALPDVWAGDAVSLCALAAALWLVRRSRRIRG